MQFKITQQYVKDHETPLAEFIDIDDAALFVRSKSAYDDTNAKVLIYRIYKDDELLFEYNKEKINIPISQAQYAQGETDFPICFVGPYCVIHQNANHQKARIAMFCHVDDAKAFIALKLSNNSSIAESYLIFNGEQFVDSADKSTINLSHPHHQAMQPKEKSVAFRPTPLATTLRMGPPKWLVQDDDDDDDNHTKD